MNFRSLLIVLPATAVSGFVIHPNGMSHLPTKLFIDKETADMIDRELWRQSHKKEFENEWMEKNRQVMMQAFKTDDVGYVMEEPEQDFRQKRKDQKMAKKDPQQYCADRCIATGNCDVYEDFFEFSPEEVIEFCNDCVLSDGDEPCDIPEAFYDIDELKP